jgi:hypothetical protein
MSLKKINEENAPMFTLLLKRFPILLLAVSFMACSVLTPAAAPTRVAGDIDKEEQSVYSFFARENSKALILQDTSTNIAGDSPQQTTDFIKSGLKDVSQQALDNYLERNQQPGELSADMNLGVDYVLLTKEDLANISSQPNWGQLLNEKYPGTHGYIIFSRVGFNNALDQAVVYVGNVDGPLMGAGYYYLMERQKGQWLVKDQVMAWIS